MLTHPTLDLLQQLGLNGMAKAFAEIDASADATALTHPEWLALLLDQEVSYRRDRRLLARLRYARLRHQAAVEDVDYRAARGLDRALFQTLVITKNEIARSTLRGLEETLEAYKLVTRCQ